MASKSTPYVPGSSLRTPQRSATTPVLATRTRRRSLYPLAHQQAVWDLPLVTPASSVSGKITDASTNPVVGATVLLMRQDDNAIIASTTTSATGYYSFLRDLTDTQSYFVLAYKAGTPQIHGTSDRGVVPS